MKYVLALIMVFALSGCNTMVTKGSYNKELLEPCPAELAPLKSTVDKEILKTQALWFSEYQKCRKKQDANSKALKELLEMKN